MVLDKGQHRLGKGLGAGRFVGRNRCRADRGLVLGDQPDGRRGAGHREGRGVRRMAMHNGAGYGVGFVDGQMQQHLAGPHAVACQDVAVQIGEADVGRRHIPLAHHRRRAEQVLLAQTDADIASVAVHVLPLPQLAAHQDNLLAQGFGLEKERGLQRRTRLGLRRVRTLRHGLHRFLALLLKRNPTLLHG